VVADTKKILVADSKIGPRPEFEMLWRTYPGRYCGLICSTLVAGVGGGTVDDLSVRDIAVNKNISVLTTITAIKTTAKSIFRFLSMPSLLHPVRFFGLF
jgi:hypothetical protein